MKELIRLFAQNYTARNMLVQSLNELGYGTRIIEYSKRKGYVMSTEYFVAIYKKEDREDELNENKN